MLQEKDVELLIKRRDKVNNQVEFIEKENLRIQTDIDKGLKNLNDIGIAVTLDTLDEVLAKYEIKVQEEFDALKLAVEKAEEELRGIV